MRLNDIDKEKVVKFPGRSGRDVSIDREKFNDLIEPLTKISDEKILQPERSQAIMRGLKSDYSYHMARFVMLMLYLLEIKGDAEQFLDLVMSKKWDDVRAEFLENYDDIIKRIRGILKSETKARAAEIGMRIVK